MQSEWRIISEFSLYEVQFEFKKYFAGKSIILPQDTENRSKEILSRLEKLDPQYFLNGNNNIWIVKPGRKSRGRDIALFSSIEDIKKYTQYPQK